MSEKDIPPDADGEDNDELGILDTCLILPVISTGSSFLLPGAISNFALTIVTGKAEHEARLAKIKDYKQENKLVAFACELGMAEGLPQFYGIVSIGYIVQYEVRVMPEGFTMIIFVARAVGRASVIDWLSDIEDGGQPSKSYLANVLLMFEPRIDDSEWFAPGCSVRRRSIIGGIFEWLALLKKFIGQSAGNIPLSNEEMAHMNATLIKLLALPNDLASSSRVPEAFLLLLASFLSDLSIDFGCNYIGAQSIAGRMILAEEFIFSQIYRLQDYLEQIKTSGPIGRSLLDTKIQMEGRNTVLDVAFKKAQERAEQLIKELDDLLARMSGDQGGRS